MMRANLISWCRAAAASAMVLLLGTGAHAEFPDKPINLIVGFSAGGGVDVVARTIAQSVSTQLKASMVVDNRTGAAGAIAAQYVKRAAPDGYTLLMAPTTSYVMSEKMVGPEVSGFEIAKDFKPVATVGELPLVMLASKQSGITKYADLIAQARKNPGKLAYGSSGNGSTEHIVTEWFKQQAGLDLLHVPYRGSAPAMADLFSDQIQIMVTTSPTALTNLAGGRAVAVGASTTQRLSVMPDVPTFAEQGLPQFIASSVYAILAPKDTPDAVVVALNKALNDALKDEATQRRFAQLGVQIVHSTPAQSRELLLNESTKWERVVQPIKAAAR